MSAFPVDGGQLVSEVDPSNTKPLSVRVRHAAFWAVGSTMSMRLLNVLGMAIVAHIMSLRDFGVFAVASIVYAILINVGQLGVASCLARADLDIDVLAPTITTVSVLSNSAAAWMMLASARPLAAALGSPAASGPIKVMAIAFFLSGIFTVPAAQMARDLRQKEIFLANILSSLTSTVVVVVLASYGIGAEAFAWSLVVNQLVRGGILMIAAPRRYRPGFSRSAFALTFRLSIPLAAANFVQNILLNVDYAFVSHLFGTRLLGIYVLAFNVASWQTAALAPTLYSLSVPVFSRVKGDRALLSAAIVTALRNVTLVAIPMCAMMVALAGPLVVALYGAKWAASSNVLAILALYGAAFVTCGLFGTVFVSLGATRCSFILQIIWIAALVPAMAIGVRLGGVIGAACAHVIVMFIVVLPGYLLILRRKTGIRFAALGRAARPALLAALGAALAARGLASLLSGSGVQLIGGLVAGAGVYVLFAGRLLAVALGRRVSTERVTRLASGFGRQARGQHRAPRGWRERPGRSHGMSFSPRSTTRRKLDHSAGHGRRLRRASSPR